ncbi:peroxisome proliferator-activated receptor gamma coactivator-related protein 1 isoform X2 [Poecilia reticulata]|uniref:peroxisome proliferator-activated receptor gamma coactivator-related protein 1 isoform X2 n=1 Tax=Poecilia reticulata TaxID=8081 RepID=UPI0007EBF169|nr:PREDICTED: peroxisome proliferator-activated receptor gamma coactivator-related protein 1-like isoform X2 [Poecilia reticulata]
MWRSNMAARKRGEESDLTTGNSEFPSRNTLNELVLSRNQDVDHSILAIFEDSAVSPESHNDAEEANESLLCALTEMLDRVGQDDDDDGIFSPFDVLPNTELLHRAEQRTDEPCLQEPSPSFRLRPRPKPPNETSRTRSNREQKVERNGRSQMLKKQNQKLFSSKNRRAKAEVEVFTSTSLVSLVKLMHPYCLKLHVEKEDDLRKNKSLFSQEEVLRYERPSEDSNEEINVVSEDEAPSKQTEEEEEGGSRGDGPLLKSVLLNGKTSREKKRVSFGPVHVASFDESEEEEIEEKSRETLEQPSGSALQPSNQPPDGNNGEQEKKKGETRSKSLSLQEYRQLRLNTRPPVEEHRDYTIGWPSVSELPKELPPILPQRRPNTAAEFSTFTQHVKLKEAKLHNHLHHRRLKSSKPEPRTSPASPPSDHSATPSGRKPDSRRSPAKKPKLISSDPPNPVLVRLHSNKHPQQIQNESPALYERSSEPKLSTSLPNEDSKAMDTPLLQEAYAKLTDMPPRVDSESPQDLSRAEQPSSPDVGYTAIAPRLHHPPTEGHMMPQEEFTDTMEPEPPQNDCRENSAADQSGIEAADLTSLLEQFEETQAIDDGICSNGPKPVPAPSSSSIKAKCQVGLDRPEPAGPELTSASPLKPPVGPLGPPSPGDGLKDVRSLDVPEPLHTEVVLSTQRNPPTRCRSLSLKLVQIIEPRPLPTRKVRTSQSEPPAVHSSAQIYAYLCCDHDYCGSAERCPPQAQQPAEAATEPERTADHVSENPRSNQTRTGSETDKSTDEALRFSPRKEADRGGRDDSRVTLCGLPTPPPTPPGRGRSRRRYRVRSPRSDSGSSSSFCSCSPKRPRIRRWRSESSSCSSSPSYCASPPRRHRAALSRSRSRSWSRSRSRSSSPQIYHRRWRDVSARESRRRSREREMRIQKLKAIDERRVVYVGRIRRTMTHDELRERFSQFGEVECVSLHFRDGSDHYGFVTFYNTENAFAAIDNGGKLRQPDELPFDLCFGGRRQFCNSDYADLDANREAEPLPPRSRFEDLDFDSLLKQAQRGLKR